MRLEDSSTVKAVTLGWLENQPVLKKTDQGGWTGSDRNRSSERIRNEMLEKELSTLTFGRREKTEEREIRRCREE